jgi:hypothetical protein
MTSWTGFAVCASKASDKAKCRFILGKRFEIILLILAAAAQVIPSGLLPFITPKVTLWISVVSAGLAIFLALLVRAIRIEEIWQEARTLSESAKKLMWFYIISVPPFAANDPVADSEFLLALQKLREQSTVSKDYLATHDINQDLITDWMREQRGLLWAKKKELYLKERVLPQVDWYTTRASLNSTGESSLFIATLAMEFAALLCAALLLGGQLGNSAWVGVFTTLAAGAHAWGKMNRYKQLADAYSMIAQQLRGQKALWIHISTEDGLKVEVEKTEELISRENTNWAVVRS